MTRFAWFHCFNGVAGDMALGALLHAGASLDVVRDTIAALPIDEWRIEPATTQRCGIAALTAGVHAPDQVHHRRYAAIRDMVTVAPIEARVRSRALATFRALAEVEGGIHGSPPDDVEFHEVGSLDAIVDIVGVCAALESLGIDEVRCSPLAVGHGTFTAAHGVLPNPGPAVVGLAARVGAPLRGVPVDVELTTPTGAALMTTLASGFGPMPLMNVAAVGYGAGRKDMKGRPNVVQVVIGDGAAAGQPSFSEPGQPVRLFEANIDDATPEVLAHAIGVLLAAGAHDAWITPIVMKKGRAAHTVHALCDPAVADIVAEVLVRETGTLGLRGLTMDRWPQQRTESRVTVDGRSIRVKRSAHRTKVEFDDAAEVAQISGRALRDVLDEAARIAP